MDLWVNNEVTSGRHFARACAKWYACEAAELRRLSGQLLRPISMVPAHARGWSRSAHHNGMWRLRIRCRIIIRYRFFAVFFIRAVEMASGYLPAAGDYTHHCSCTLPSNKIQARCAWEQNRGRCVSLMCSSNHQREGYAKGTRAILAYQP